LYISLQDLEQASSLEFCHLCTILWHSMEQSKRQTIAEEDKELERELHQLETSHLGTYDMSCIERQEQIHQTMQLRIKIWEDHDGPWYDEYRRFIQLYRGQAELCGGIAIKEGSISSHH
jgi:hypothetical protein